MLSTSNGTNNSYRVGMKCFTVRGLSFCLWQLVEDLLRKELQEKQEGAYSTSTALSLID